MTSQHFLYYLKTLSGTYYLVVPFRSTRGQQQLGKKHQQLLLLMDKRDVLIQTENS